MDARKPAKAPAAQPDEALEELRASLRELLATVLERAFGLALDKVEQLAETFEHMAAQGGPTLNALLGGARAKLAGRNPIWGAITGAVSSLSPAAKAALIVVLVLALLLVPVTVVLLLLTLIVLAIVAVTKSASAAS